MLQMGANLSLMDKEGLTAMDIVIKDRPKQVEISDKVPCQVYLWGSNDNYTLGTGTNKFRKAPELLDKFKRSKVSIKQVQAFSSYCHEYIRFYSSMYVN